ncbi:uncharacterized protein LOC127131534 [Lathyrus oleraceus]|nr:uncharacterized protein LOC127131534 [Pisum sativum]
MVFASILHQPAMPTAVEASMHHAIPVKPHAISQINPAAHHYLCFRPSDTPTIVAVPSTNPVTISPTNPAAMPVTVPSTTPVVPLPPTNPTNSPVPVFNPATTPSTVPGAQPVTNPVTSYPPPSGSVPVPVINPPSNTNAPSVQGQSWCVAKAGAPQASLQSALDYACGMDADCSQIQQGGSCFSPVTLQSHVSFAFNSYYQKNPAPTSCNFGGAATLINTNPNSSSCIFPSSLSSSSSTPTISSPTPPTQSTPTAIPPPSPITTAPSIQTAPSSIPTVPPTSSGSRTGTFGYGTPPSVLNSSSPDSGAMPDLGSDSPPVVNTTFASHPRALKSFTGCIILMIPFVTARHSMLISQGKRYPAAESPNKALRIIFYKDDVSEGHFYQVLLYELDAIRKACAPLEPNY